MLGCFSRDREREHIIHELLISLAPLAILKKEHPLTDLRRFIKDSLPFTSACKVLGVNLHINPYAVSSEHSIDVLTITGRHLRTLNLNRGYVVILNCPNNQRLRHILLTVIKHDIRNIEIVSVLINDRSR